MITDSITILEFEQSLVYLNGARSDRTGGICDQRYAMNGQKASFNTGIVSMMNFGAYVGHDVSFIILAHELGHNFGATVSIVSNVSTVSIVFP
jgi:hypothetical protein